MADIDIRLNKIEKNCYEIAKKDLKLLKEENDSVISEKKQELVNMYKDELSKKYEVTLDKMNKDYNKSLFDYETSQRKKVNEYKSELINSIYFDVKKEITNFLKSNKYKEYLLSNIESTINNVKSINDCILYITEADYFEYSSLIKNMFNVKLEKIDNEFLGGCIIVDTKNKLSIDNTFKTNLDEYIKRINF